MVESTFERFKEKLERTSITEKLDYKTLLIHALRTVETSILSGDKYIIEPALSGSKDLTVSLLRMANV